MARALVYAAPMSDYCPPDTPLDILHDDHELLVVNKPAGLLSVPGKGADLADCLLARVQEAFPTALLVHRLDRDTSGVMVFALSPHAQRHLGLQFEKRHVKKTYVARVFGRAVAQDGHGRSADCRGLAQPPVAEGVP